MSGPGPAVFVFGAGASRGASFTANDQRPCKPPLDADFFTQLQRVANPKHQHLIADVMKDVVRVFGQNFSATMEEVFTTLEHTQRMLEVTGSASFLSKSELREMRDRLMQAVAVVLEESLTDRGSKGGSSRNPTPCTYHERFVRDVLRPGDTVISFNYDLILDYAFKRKGSGKWNAEVGYGIGAAPSAQSELRKHERWQPSRPALKSKSARLLKLHGSLNFRPAGNAVELKERPYTHQHGRLHFLIIPPEWEKKYDSGVFSDLWKEASRALNSASDIVFIGYSLPASDLHSTALFRTATGSTPLKSLVVVNPDREARKRTRSVLQRALDPATRILSFDYFKQFLELNEGAWRQRG